MSASKRGSSATHALIEREKRLSQEQAAVASQWEAVTAGRQAIENRASELQRILAEIDAGTARLESDKRAAADALSKSEAALKTRAEAMQRRESELAEALVLLGRESQRLSERRTELESAGGSTSESLQGTCAALTAEKARLEARLSESQKSISAVEARAATLAAQIEELAAQRTAANDRAVASQAQAAQCEARLVELETEKAAVATQLAAVEARTNDLAARAAEWEPRNRALVEENSTLTSERAKLAEQLGRLTSENSDAQAELSRLTAERDAALRKTGEAAQATDERSRLAQQARAAEFEKLAADLGAERTALASKTATLERERAELIEQRKQLESHFTESEQQAAKLKEQFEATEQAGADERDLAMRLKARNGQLEENIRALQTEVEAARRNTMPAWPRSVTSGTHSGSERRRPRVTVRKWRSKLHDFEDASKRCRRNEIRQPRMSCSSSLKPIRVLRSWRARPLPTPLRQNWPTTTKALATAANRRYKSSKPKNCWRSRNSRRRKDRHTPGRPRCWPPPRSSHSWWRGSYSQAFTAWSHRYFGVRRSCNSWRPAS